MASKAKIDKASVTLRLSDGATFKWDTKGGAPVDAFIKRLTELAESLDPESNDVGCNLCGRAIPDAEAHVCTADSEPHGSEPKEGS